MGTAICIREAGSRMKQEGLMGIESGTVSRSYNMTQDIRFFSSHFTIKE